MGSRTRVRQGLPSLCPGDHGGIMLSTRKASLSSRGSTPCSTLASAMVPSLLTTNVVTTVPCRLRCRAGAGYCRLSVSHLINGNSVFGNVYHYNTKSNLYWFAGWYFQHTGGTGCPASVGFSQCTDSSNWNCPEHSEDWWCGKHSVIWLTLSDWHHHGH